MPNPWEGNVGSDNKVIEGTEREKEAGLLISAYLCKQYGKCKGRTGSIGTEPKLYVNWQNRYNGITHVTGISIQKAQIFQEKQAGEKAYPETQVKLLKEWIKE